MQHFDSYTDYGFHENLDDQGVEMCNQLHILMIRVKLIIYEGSCYEPTCSLFLTYMPLELLIKFLLKLIAFLDVSR